MQILEAPSIPRRLGRPSNPQAGETTLAIALGTVDACRA